MLFLVTARLSRPGWGGTEEIEVKKQKKQKINKKKGARISVWRGGNQVLPG